MAAGLRIRGGGRRDLLIETDFLFGLREGDRLHARVERALDLHRRGDIRLVLLSSAAMEFAAVLHSHGLGPREAAEAVALTLASLAEAGVRECAEVTLEDVLVAERLKQGHAELGFFDSIHAAVAKRRRVPLLSADGVYSRVGVPHLNLRDL